MTPRIRSLLAAAALILVVPACSGDDDPKATELGDEAVGWCLDISPQQDAEVTDLPRVDCEEPHTHEVFAVFESDAETYPGFDALETEAQVGCLDRFEAYVGISPFDSTLFYSWMVPTLASWGDQNIENAGDEPGDREIICIVGLQGDAQIDGGDRLQDSNR